MLNSVLAQDLLFLMGLLIGSFSLVNGLKTGRASYLVPGGFKRSEQPFLYWMAMAMSGAAIVVCLFFLITDLVSIL
jgi:hypothetical protein